jgi:LAO/AO transport system kinase
MLLDALMAGDRRALGRAITLAETGGDRAAELGRQIREHTGNARVIGVTGPPGAGKSTLTNRLIGALRAGGQSVAVLAVDPSSPISGGAILGDRLRMTSHTDDDDVFIRSLAARGHLGGLTASTPAVIDILDAGGYQQVILETVGTGQSEVEVGEIADIRVVVCTPGMGDDIQAMKAGLFEIADILVVNKSDQDGVDQTVRHLESMLSLRGPEHTRAVIVQTTATKGDGVDDLLSAIDRCSTILNPNERRRDRTRRLLAGRAAELLREHLLRHDSERLDTACRAYENGERSLEQSARDLLKLEYP